MREIKFRGWNGKRMTRGYTLYEMLSIELESNGIRENWLQYTGLQDKNGKEIYEGDIIKWGHAREYSKENPIRIAEVKINPDIQFHSQVGVFKFGNFAYAESIDKDVEVIGNIYENQELLK